MDRLELSWKIIFLIGLLGFTTGLYFVLIRPSQVLMPSDTDFAGITSSELRIYYPNLFAWMGYAIVAWGAFAVGVCMFTMAVAATAYRNGERWAWLLLVFTDLFVFGTVLATSLLVRSELAAIVYLAFFGMMVALALPAKEFLKPRRG